MAPFNEEGLRERAAAHVHLARLVEMRDLGEARLNGDRVRGDNLA